MECKINKQCGSCQYINMSYDKQLVKKHTKYNELYKDFKVKDEFSKIPGIASGGQYYLTNKFFELFYLLKLMEKLLKEEYKDKEEAKKKIEEIIIKDEFKDDGTLQGKSLGVKNLLLH